MKESSSQPGLLTSEQHEHAVQVLTRCEITVFSCLYWRMDTPDVVQLGRTSPDDFVYAPVKGTLDFKIGNRWCRIAPGALVMIPAGVSHGARFSADTDDLEAYALHLHAADDQHRSVFESLNRPGGKVRVPDYWFQRLALCTHLMGTDRDAGRRYAAELVQDLLLEQVMQGTKLLGKPRQMDSRIAMVVGTIRRQFVRDLRIEDLAASARLSAGRFRQLFKDCVGASPKQYLQQVRLAHARALLKTEPWLTVQEVAIQSGFNHPHNFHILYRETYGETPRGTQTTRTEEDGGKKNQRWLCLLGGAVRVYAPAGKPMPLSPSGVKTRTRASRNLNARFLQNGARRPRRYWSPPAPERGAAEASGVSPVENDI